MSKPWMVAMMALAGVGLVVIGASAQKTATDPSADIGKRVEDSSCGKASLQALFNAVDPGQADRQEWNLNAAKAYRELAELGATC